MAHHPIKGVEQWCQIIIRGAEFLGDIQYKVIKCYPGMDPLSGTAGECCLKLLVWWGGCSFLGYPTLPVLTWYPWLVLPALLCSPLIGLDALGIFGGVLWPTDNILQTSGTQSLKEVLSSLNTWVGLPVNMKLHSTLFPETKERWRLSVLLHVIVLFLAKKQQQNLEISFEMCPSTTHSFNTATAKRIMVISGCWAVCNILFQWKEPTVLYIDVVSNTVLDSEWPCC